MDHSFLFIHLILWGVLGLKRVKVCSWLQLGAGPSWAIMSPRPGAACRHGPSFPQQRRIGSGFLRLRERRKSSVSKFIWVIQIHWRESLVGKIHCVLYLILGCVLEEPGGVRQGMREWGIVVNKTEGESSWWIKNRAREGLSRDKPAFGMLFWEEVWHDRLTINSFSLSLPYAQALSCLNPSSLMSCQAKAPLSPRDSRLLLGSTTLDTSSFSLPQFMLPKTLKNPLKVLNKW